MPALGRSLPGQVAHLEQVVAGLALGAVVMRPGGDAPPPVLGGAPVSLDDLAAPLPFGQPAVQLESGPAVHEHRGRVVRGVGRQQAGGPAFVEQAGQLGRAVLTDGKQQDVAADRRAVDGGADQQALRLGAELVEQVAQQQVGDGQGGRLRGRQWQFGRRGEPVAGRGVIRVLPDRPGEALGQRREAGVTGQEQRVQVLHGPGMTAQQPPGPVQFLFAEQPQGGQGHRQLDRAGAGQRPEVTEPQPGRGRLGHGEPVTAGDQDPAPVRLGRPSWSGAR